MQTTRLLPPVPDHATSELLRSVFAQFHLALVVAIVVLHPSPAPANGGWQQQEFVIGALHDPLLGAEHYRLAAEAGFNVLMGELISSSTGQFDEPYTPRGRHAALSAAAAAGLSTFFTDPHYTIVGDTIPGPDPFPHVSPELFFSMFDTEGSDALSPVQNDALFGYSMWDEPGFHPENETWLKYWTEEMHANDTARGDGHYRAVFLNFLPALHSSLASYATSVSQFVNDSMAARRVDVVSATLYPFVGIPPAFKSNESYFGTMGALRAAMGTRPFWVVSYLGSDTSNESDPDDNQLRFMAYAPVAAGARGIIWYLYRVSNMTSQDPVVHSGGPPSCKYYSLIPINNYLRDVVGPVVMSSEHLGIFHKSIYPPLETDLDLLANDSLHVSPVADLDNANFCVGVFRPVATPSEYYVFIMNKALTPQSCPVTLRQSYTVTQSPIALSYAGGSSYGPLATGSTFTVSLQGGEGRMFRLTSAPTPDIVLTSPLPEAFWPAGSAAWVTWQGNGNPVNLTLFTDTRNFNSADHGPSTTLATGLTGNSAYLVMPAGTFSRRARLVLESQAPGGALLRVTNATSFTTAPGAPTGTVWPFSSGRCYASSSLVLGDDGQPRLAYYDANSRNLRFARFDGVSWQDGLVREGLFSNSIATAIDGQQRSRIASSQTPYTIRESALTHSIQATGDTWLSQQIVVDKAAQYLSEMPTIGMVPTSDGEVVIAYPTGFGFGDRLNLIKSTTTSTLGVTWAPYSFGSIEIARPRSISLVRNPASGAIWIAFLAGEEGSEEVHLSRITETGHEPAPPVTGPHKHVALALDGMGLPRIAYASEAAGGVQSDVLYYATYDGSAWSTPQLVDAAPMRITSMGIAFQSGMPRILYAANGVLKFASWNGTAWSLGTIGDQNELVGPVHIRYDAAGKRWASFFNRDANDLRVEEFDTVAPATTGDLRVTSWNASARSCTLKWTAPGDDQYVGKAANYVIRKRSGQEITATNWASSQTVPGPPVPAVAGTTQSVFVDGLTGPGFWYFALRATDEANNTSGVSNNDCIKFSSPPEVCAGGGLEARAPREETEPEPVRLLAIHGVRPNPAPRGETEVTFSLAEDSPASLEVLDVAGRRVEVHDLMGVGPASQVIRIGTRAKLPQGHYWVRLRQGDRLVKTSALVIR